jgi:hypothetical protein
VSIVARRSSNGDEAEAEFNKLRKRLVPAQYGHFPGNEHDDWRWYAFTDASDRAQAVVVIRGKWMDTVTTEQQIKDLFAHGKVLLMWSRKLSGLMCNWCTWDSEGGAVSGTLQRIGKAALAALNRKGQLLILTDSSVSASRWSAILNPDAEKDMEFTSEGPRGRRWARWAMAAEDLKGLACVMHLAGKLNVVAVS